ncbi:prepilin peptidase [Actinoplanes friuliensis]|uniref:prepilin peptidase n=1 Tax=Actinoplanes friuliensis TaxID=196914 RepID=UPI0005A21A9B|nr:prepilin peptidase [Actinoplanes friuliensis]
MSLPVAVLSALFGGAAAAFLPRVTHRLSVPRGSPPRAVCATCQTSFSTWVSVGAPCRCAPPPVWTIATGALVTGLLGATVGPTPLLAVLLPAAVLGILLAAVDLRCLRLPNPLVAVLAAVTVVPLGLSALLIGEPDRLARAGLAALLTGLVYLLVALLPGAGLGLGDVKLAAVLCFTLGFAGWPAVAIGLLTPHLINGPIALTLLLTRRAKRRTALPLGPALLIGALVALVTT